MSSPANSLLICLIKAGKQRRDRSTLRCRDYRRPASPGSLIMYFVFAYAEIFQFS